MLTAYQDVEDNLAALRQLQRESVSQAAAVTATQGALEQAKFRYKGGIVTYLEVVAAENAALAARLAAVDIQLRRIDASVLLVKALGGTGMRDRDEGRAAGVRLIFSWASPRRRKARSTGRTSTRDWFSGSAAS